MWLYDCLSIPVEASKEEIELAYFNRMETLNSGWLRRRLNKVFHFSYPAEYAHWVLSHPERRQNYDRNPWSYSSITPASVLYG